MSGVRSLVQGRQLDERADLLFGGVSEAGFVTNGYGPLTTRGSSLFPLRSELRTREQMEWIHDRYKVDALERLARSTPDYYKTHGDYLPDVSALAHAAIYEAQRLHSALEELLAVAERIRGGDPSLDPEEWYAIRDYARVTLNGGPSGA